MNRDSLLYFHRLCAMGSFATAAASIPMTVQGLRKTVHALESELGVELCHSTRNGVVPTEGGRLLDAFYQEVEPLYARLDADLERLRTTGVRPLKLGFSFGLFGLVYDAVLELPTDPSAPIEYASLPEGSLVREMEAGSFDLALTWGETTSDVLAYEPVAAIGMYAVGRRDHPLLSGGAPITLADLEGCALVSVGKLHKPHQLLMQACTQRDVRPGRVYEASEMPVTQAYLRQGLGIGLALPQERTAYDEALFTFARITDFSLPMGITYRYGHEPQGTTRELADLLARRLRQAAS